MRVVAAALLTASVFAGGSLSACSPRPTAQPPVPLAPDTGSVGPTLNGRYTFVVDGRRASANGAPVPEGIPSTTTWEITPCGPACSHVTSSLGWNVDFRLDGRVWQGTREWPVDCRGNAVTSSMTYVLDATTLTGTATNEVPCGQPPVVVVAPVTLTKK